MSANSIAGVSVNRPDTSNWSDLFAWRKAINSPRGPKKTTAAILNALSMYFDAAGRGATMNVLTLAADTGYSAKTVGDHLRVAGRADWIARRPITRPGQGFKGWKYSLAFPDGGDPRLLPELRERVVTLKVLVGGPGGREPPTRQVPPGFSKDLTRAAIPSGSHDGREEEEAPELRSRGGGCRCPSGDTPREDNADRPEARTLQGSTVGGTGRAPPGGNGALTTAKGVAVTPSPQSPPRDLLRAVVAARLTERLTCSLVERYGPVRSPANWKRAVTRELAADPGGLHREAVRLGLAPPRPRRDLKPHNEPEIATGPSAWDEHQARRAQQVEAWGKVDPEVRRRQAGPNEVMAGLAAQGASFALEHLAELHGWPGGVR